MGPRASQTERKLVNSTAARAQVLDVRNAARERETQQESAHLLRHGGRQVCETPHLHVLLAQGKCLVVPLRVVVQLEELDEMELDIEI
jgi:hypothetical protein